MVGPDRKASWRTTRASELIRSITSSSNNIQGKQAEAIYALARPPGLPPDNARYSRAANKRYPVELEILNALISTSANGENPMRHCSTQNRLADLLLKNQEISRLVAQLQGS